MEIKTLTTLEELESLGSALTMEGLAEDSISEFIDWIKQYTPMKSETAYIIKGKTMNDVYMLTGNNKYPDDCTIVSIKLKLKGDVYTCMGFDGDIPLVSDENNKLKWECPSCGNTDNTTMDIAFRVCGYIGTAKNGGNQGRYGDIHDRVYHLDDMEYTED